MRAGAEGPKRTVLRANGSTLVKPGYISVYQEGLDHAVQDDSDHVLLPIRRAIGSSWSASCHSAFHRAAAALLGGLAGQGAGRVRHRPPLDLCLDYFHAARPSVRGYRKPALYRDRYRQIVSRFLTQYFTTYVDYDFTAKMEDSLDAVASGEQEWVPLLERFWKPFIELVKHTETSVSREEVAQARDLGADPVSGKPMSVRMGRFGPFVQIGTKDDEGQAPIRGLRPGQKMDRITHEQAMELFKLPRKLGRLRPAMKSRPTSDASARTSNTAPSTFP